MNDEIHAWIDDREREIYNAVDIISDAVLRGKLTGDMAITQVKLAAKLEVLEHLILFLDEIESDRA